MLLASQPSRQKLFRLAVFCFSLLASATIAQTLRFQDVTAGAGVSTPEDPNGFGHGVAAGDFNNDGLPDIYVVNYTALNALFLNNGNGTFDDNASSARVANTTTLEDRGVAAADYDNDGDLDLYIATAASANKILYRNDGNGTFTDATFQAGLSDYGLQGQGVSWGDYDNDGDLDLFLCSYDQPFKLYRQNADHSFDEVTYSAGLDGATESVQAVFFDCDLDGDLDIFVGRGAGQSNRLFVNQGNGTFREESASRNIADPAPHAQGIAVGDYDNDGDLDLYMCDDRGPNRLYRNDNGSFSEVAAQAGVADNSRSLGCHFADFDNDGWLDLYVINFGANRLYRNNGNGTFANQSSGSGADNSSRGYGSVVLDYDNDGGLDIFFSNSGQNSNLLRNTTATSNKWLRLALAGVESNRNGIGTRVLVTSGGSVQTQQLVAGFAMVSGGNDLTLHFGLANNSVASRVEVIWPSGERDVLTNVAANQTLTIEEGSYGDGGSGDNDAPIISNVSSSNQTSSSATITWNTNEASDSQVEYGTSTSYGSLSTLDATRVPSHAITLSGLSASTTYHYRVRSKDAAGNLGMSGNFTFTTLANTGTGTLFADDFNSGTLNTSNWHKGTNSGNQTVVASNRLELRSNSSQSGWIVTKQNFSARNTTASVRVTQPNDDGVLGLSPTYQASAADGIYNEANRYRFYVYREGAGNYYFYVEWKKNGVLGGLDVTGNTSLPSQSEVYLRMRCDDTRIYFESSLNNVNWTTRYSETFALPGYNLDSKFYYELAASRTPTKGVMIVDDFSLIGPGAPVDTQAPVITNVVSSAITSTSATITWTTNEASDTQVEYGTSTNYGSLSTLDANRVSAHSITLSGLSASTTYHYRVRSKDAAGNLGVSNNFIFTTIALPVDTQAPVITNVASGAVTSTSATITWTTNEASDTQVEYGATTSYGLLSPLNPALVTTHSVTLTGLTANTTYHYRARSKDTAGNLGVSSDFIFQTNTSGTPVTRTIISDPLNGSTLGARTGGLFENTGGWRVTTPSDMLVYDLGAYVESGALEIELSNFRPTVQNSHNRQHFLSMYRNPWGNHHPRENTETVWNLHAGTNYAPGVKLLSWTYNENEEKNTIVEEDFDQSRVYRVRMAWSGNQLQYFLDGVLQATHIHSASMQVRYLYVGRDFTVSGDFVTNFNGNQYPGLVGPIYENLVVTETLATSDNVAPQISGMASTELFANAARVAWTTNEATTCYVEYGATTAYGQRTPVLGPPTQNHETVLAALNPNQTYHYRIVAQDEAGNKTNSANASFTTNASGVFLFKPMADTYVERGGVHGTTRDRANFGWMSLLVSSNHENYLRFQVQGLNAPIQQSKLRLRVRQAGTSNATIRRLLGAWEESSVTWLTKPGQLGDTLGTLTSFAVNQWRETALKSFVTGNATYNLALLGTTAGEVALDSRESTNFQPELIVTLQDTIAPLIANVSAGNTTHEAVTISWTTNEASDSQVEYGLSTSYGSLSVLDTNRVTAHALTLAGLQANSTYHYRVRSRDAAGNLRLSSDFVFTTLPAPLSPVISNLALSELTHESVKISWSTDRPADAQVEYGLSTSYGSLSALDTAKVAEHSAVLTGLSANMTYHFRVKSRDRAGNLAVSNDSTFTTKPTPLPVVALHGIYEFTLRAQQITPNNYVLGPNVNVTLQGVAGAALGSTMTVQGFWEGGDLYRVRFAPNKTGEWSWQTSSSDAGLHNKSGGFRCEGALAAPHVSQRGHVRESKTYPYTYAHADSTPFFLHGDTQWSFATSAIAWPTEFQAYVSARAAQGFNYVHGLIYNVYPKGNESNEGGPTFYGSDVDSLNPAFFRALDQRVAYMNEKGIVVGLMFAWGNGGWLNFASTAQADRFVRYVINRYAAYNVFWIVAGEYEEATPVGGYTRLGELVAAHDVYDHPITIHTIHTSATALGNAAWQTTIYQQVFHSRQVTPDRVYNKPVINSEYGYEGDQTAEEVRKDAWQIVMRGGFGVYGDTNTYHFDAKMTPQFLNSPGAGLMTILKNFWTGNYGRAIAWQRFTRFEVTSNVRFLAGRPGAEYVAYSEARGAFNVNLSEANGVVNGQWFNTRTGTWGTTFSAAASATFTLTPPDSGYAAYLYVVPPVAPPVISQVQASNLTSTAATITWQTDKLADTQVEYGLSTGYGSLSVLDTTKVLAHQITLTNLAPNTLYHFRVRSREQSGVLGLSDDFTFTTQAPPPLFADDFNATTLDLNKWQRGTNSENQSGVVNGELELRSLSVQSGWVITKQAFIAQNTTVTVKVTQPNDDGALGMSPTFKLNSTSGIYGEENWYRFYVYRETPGDYRLYVEWLRSGVKDGLDVTGNMVINGPVYLRLRTDATTIYFEASLNGQQWTTTYSEAFALPGYTLSDKFYYELAASRTALRGVLRVDDFKIEALVPQPIDTKAPVIANVAASTITANSAQITWSTDEASDAQVEYGLTSTYGNFSARDSSFDTAHTLTLANLLADTTYHFRVRSKDAAGNLAVSNNFTFKTLAGGSSNILLVDDFNTGVLDANKWQRGTNSGNTSVISGNALQLQSTGSQSGWVMTKQAYVARNTTVEVKVTQPNNDGALGMSPTYSLSSTGGFHGQSNWYRFYVYRNQASGPYRLYVEWKRNGVLDGFDATRGLVINGEIYLRLRFDETAIYFEASFNDDDWITVHNEVFALPGSSLSSAFYYELAAYRSSSNGVLRVDDFYITTNNTSGLAKSFLVEEEKNSVPENFALSQNYPNPFNIETRLQLALPEPGRVQAVIYNMQGQEVQRLHEGEFNAGMHMLGWNGSDERNLTVSSGIYILRVIFEGASGKREMTTRRLMLMK